MATAALVAGQAPVADDQLFATVASMMAVTAAITGGLFVIFGVFKIGEFARYVPYPVIGGFLAATGLLLVLAAIAMSTGHSVRLFGVHHILMESPAIQWSRSLAVAAGLFAVGRLSDHPAVLTGSLAVALIAFYAILLLTGTSLADARTLGLLLGAPAQTPSISLAEILLPNILAGADYRAILAQAPTLITVSGLAAVGMVMSATGLEHTTRQEVEINREFVGTGLANLGAAAMGGLPVYHYFGATTLAHTLGLRSAVAGLSAGAVCIVLVLAGSGLVENLPVCVLAGLSGIVGLNLLYEWVVTKRQTLPALDYAVVLLILVVGMGFLEGVATGLIACIAIFVVLSSRQDVVMRSVSTATRQSMVDRDAAARSALVEYGHRNQIIELKGHLFFGTANRLYQDVAAFLSAHETASVVLDFRRVQSIDSSAMYSFEKLVARCEQSGTQVAITHLPARLRNASGLQAALSSGIAIAFDELDEGMEWAEDRLLRMITAGAEAAPKVDLLDVFASTAAPYARSRTLEPGEPLVSVGEPSDGYFIVEDGQLAVTIPTRDGKRFRIRTVGPGALVGEVGHYTGTARTATVAAIGQCRVLHVSQAALDELERADASAASHLHKLAAQYLARRLTENTLLIEHTR